MALRTPTTTDRVVVLGWSDPKEYEAGEMNGRPFAAGYYARLCVGSDHHDFTVIKVKDAEIDKFARAMQGVERGDTVEVEYSISNGTYRFFDLRKVEPDKAAKPSAA